MKTANRYSIFTLAGLSLYAIAFGLLYATRTEQMPHHDAITPDEITTHILPLYFALMRLAGAAATALGLACLYIMLGPARAGAKGSITVVSICLGGLFASAAFAASRLQEITNIATHWEIMAGLAILAGIGFALQFTKKP